jgi:type IV pilus assembly protein PilA
MLKNFKLNYNNKGFTLIELMIVIAIIGILAAIAVPNFIAYRNKTFCSAVESDAASMASAIADYFAIPSHTNIADGDVTITMSNGNTETVTATAPNTAITITVTDGSDVALPIIRPPVLLGMVMVYIRK